MFHLKSFIALSLLLLGTLTLAAENDIVQRGCRRGVMSESTRSRRVKELPRHVGGDFYLGDRRQLVILAAFQDKQFQGGSAEALSKWDQIFNAENYQESPFVGSVHDYFYDQSYGKFNLKFDLIYVNLPDSCKKYRSTAIHDEYSQFMVDDIVDALQTMDVAWDQYDWNGDGFVNQLLIIYAGKGMNADGDKNTVWPHQWWLSSHIDQTDPQGINYRSYRTVNYGDKAYNVDCYCCIQELIEQKATKSSFGTICHEYSHCFGFPDFYYGYSKPLGDWELMDSGNYNDAGFCPPCYSAHERWMMGWSSPIELTADTVVSLMPALCYEPQSYLIRNDGYENEYYIVENRQKTGWDSFLPGSGLLVFHVDYDESIWTSIEESPNDSYKKRYHIIPANNKTYYSASNSAGWTYPYINETVTNDSLTNKSQPAAILNNPNTDGSMLMNKSLKHIRVEDGLASFSFIVDSPTGIIDAEAEGRPQELYRFGSIGIYRYPNGVVKKVIIRP